MTIKIIKNKCIGCGACAIVDEEHFKLNYSTGKAEIIKQPKKIPSTTRQAIDNCPVNAIITDSDNEKK